MKRNRYAYIQKSIERMFRESDNHKTCKSKTLPLAEYFHLAVRNCVRLAGSGNVDAERRLPEIFFSLALYYENGETMYNITKDIRKADEFLEMAVMLDMAREVERLSQDLMSM